MNVLGYECTDSQVGLCWEFLTRFGGLMVGQTGSDGIVNLAY